MGLMIHRRCFCIAVLLVFILIFAYPSHAFRVLPCYSNQRRTYAGGIMQKCPIDIVRDDGRPIMRRKKPWHATSQLEGSTLPADQEGGGGSVEGTTHLNDDKDDVLSGEEVVLACRAYLQRKNRFENGWKKQDQRKELERQVSAAREDSSFSGSIGYFWENIAELNQFHDRESTDNGDGSWSSSLPKKELGEEIDDKDLYDLKLNNGTDFGERSHDIDTGGTPTKYLYYDGNTNDEMLSEHAEQYGEDAAAITSDSVIMGEGEFTGFPTFPSQERMNRSSAAKKKWNDPVWKAMWYERRWGSSARQRQKQRRHQLHREGDAYRNEVNMDDLESVSNIDVRFNPNHYSYQGGSFFPSSSTIQNSKSKKEKKKQKILEDKIRSVPPELLESPILASMTEDEISVAIESYISANRKRREKKIQNPYGRINANDDNIHNMSNEAGDNDVATTDGDNNTLPTTLMLLRAQKQQLQEQEGRQQSKPKEETKPKTKRIPRDALLTESPDIMKKAQQERSERAKKAYQKRLLNQQQKQEHIKQNQQELPRQKSLQQGQESKQQRQRRIVPSAQTPRDALIRIEAALDMNQLPSEEDIQLIIKPLKLGRRKEIFRRILLEHFDLRGKCVPQKSFNDANEEKKDKPSSSKMTFITQSTVEQLGEFVLHKIHEQTG